MKKILFYILILSGSFTTLGDECGAMIDSMKNIGELKKVLHCMNKKDSATAQPTPRSFQKTNIKIKETKERFLFEAQGCHRTATNIACTIRITNKNKEESRQHNPSQFAFGIQIDSTKFFDEFGDEHNAISANIGNTKMEVTDSSNERYARNGFLGKYMPLGIPMKAVINFNDISNEITAVLALNIKFKFHEGGAETYVTLKNIAIQGNE